ncbi:MAG: tripartite tricarboxylate transporter TctB family protein [Acidimicrobiia bacterium]|nr:tripartite tricarboxylate transporter TctB family protein [Acidimicrobiia bacterium]
MTKLLRRHSTSAFTLAVVLFIAGVIYGSTGMKHQARFFPLAIGIPTLVLAIIQLATEIVRTQRREEGEAQEDEGILDLAFDRDVPLDVVVRRGGTLALWIVGYFTGILLFGFVIASPAFVLLYLVFRARAKVWIIVLCILLVLALHIGVFDRVLHVPWLKGVWPGPQKWVLDLFS